MLTHILDTIRQYKQTNKSDFLNEIEQYYKSATKLSKLPENELALSGVLLELAMNSAKYRVYLKESLSKQDSEQVYRALTLSDNQLNNLMAQIEGIKKHTFKICFDVKKATKAAKATNKLYAVIYPQTHKSDIGVEVPQELFGVIFGIETLYFLEHQNLERYCSSDIITHTEKNFPKLFELKEKIRKLSVEQQNRIMLHSGLLYQFLGTLYSKDIDVIMLCHSNAEKEEIKAKLSEFDLSLIVDEQSGTRDSEVSYKNKYYFYKLPQMVGARDMYEVILNPKYHFYFMGIKCMSLQMNIKKGITRSHPFAFIDLVLLKMFNNISSDEACIKNITVRQGKARVTSKAAVDQFYKTMMRYLKEWYNMDIKYDYLKQHFIKCEEKFGTIYKQITTYIDPLIKSVIYLNRQVSLEYLRKYAQNAEYLLDIGSGKLSSAYIYDELHIKNVYGIEPSLYSISAAKPVIDQYPKVNFILEQNYGNKPFDLKKKFNVITLIFTIHYMITNLDILIENIMRASKPGTKIIITFVNGEMVKEALKNKDSFEIRYDNDIYWGVYRYNDPTLNKVLFYMKDTYGLENGSEEHIVNPRMLVDTFVRSGFNLLKHNSFDAEIRNNPKLKKTKILPFQYEIFRYHKIMIFEKR